MSDYEYFINTINFDDSLDNRKEFDIAVLSAFGIEKYYGTIYNSLISLYDMRKTVKK